MIECLPARKQGLKQRAEESQPLIVTIEKSGWYIPRWWTAKVGVPVKCRELGEFYDGWEKKWRWLRGVFRVTMSKATTERDSINSKSAAKQHDLCSLRKYHSTLFTKNREGE